MLSKANVIAVERPSSTTFVLDAGVVFAATAFMALCAHIAVPLWFTPVPITLQTFGVVLIALALGRKRATAAMLIYLAEGAIGLPVFSAAAAPGLAHLAGPTAGFLLSYPAAAFIGGIIADRAKSRIGMLVAAALACEAIIFVSGTAWLSLWAHTGFVAAVVAAVVPFIPGEVLKVAAAVGITSRWRMR